MFKRCGNRFPTLTALLLVLLVISCLLLGAHSQPKREETKFDCAQPGFAQLAQLPTISFNDWSKAGVGVKSTATTTELECEIAGSCATWFPHRINISGGAIIEFTYNMHKKLINSDITGFAFVVQQAGSNARDGSYHRLGYNIPRAFGIEFDYKPDAPGENDSNTPHAQAFSGTNVNNSYLPDPAYSSSSAIKLGCTPEQDCPVRIEISPFPTGANTISINYKVGTVSRSQNISITSASQGDPLFREVFVGFTSSATNIHTYGPTIKNLSIKTAPARIALAIRYGTDVPVVKSKPDGVEIYELLFSSCHSEIKYDTYETILSRKDMSFSSLRDDCISEVVSRPSRSSLGIDSSAVFLTYSCRQPVDKVSILNFTYTDHGGTQHSGSAEPISIAAGPPDSRTSYITHVNGETFKATDVPTFSAGDTVRFTVLLKDALQNNVQWKTSGLTLHFPVYIRIPGVDGDQSGGGNLLVSPQSSSVDVDVLMQKATSAGNPSVIEVSVLSNIIPLGYKAHVVAGKPHPNMVALESGHNTQYAAGSTIKIVIVLFDQYGNRVNADNNDDIQHLELSINATGSTSCSGSNDPNFVTCPSKSVENGRAVITAVPRKATTYSLVCGEGSTRCRNVNGVAIQVVPAVEHQPSSELIVPSRIAQVNTDYRGTLLRVFDRYGNQRTSANTQPFDLTFTSTTNDEYTLAFKCGGSNSSTFENEEGFPDHTISASCTFINGAYSITLKSTYADVNGYTLSVNGEASISKTVYVQAVTPVSVTGTPTPSTQLLAGDPYTIVAQFYDAYGNTVREVPDIDVTDQVQIWGVMALMCTGGPGSSMDVDRSFAINSNPDKGQATATFDIVNDYTCSISIRRDTFHTFTASVQSNYPDNIIQNSHSTEVGDDPAEASFTYRARDKEGNLSDKLDPTTLTLVPNPQSLCDEIEVTNDCSAKSSCTVTFTNIKVVDSQGYVCTYTVTNRGNNIGIFTHTVTGFVSRLLYISEQPFSDDNKPETGFKQLDFAGVSGTTRSFYIIAFEDNDYVPPVSSDIMFNFFDQDDNQVNPVTFDIIVTETQPVQFKIDVEFGQAGEFFTRIMFRGSVFEHDASSENNQVDLRIRTVAGPPSLTLSTFDFVGPSQFTACGEGEAADQNDSLYLALVDDYGNKISYTDNLEAALNQFTLKCSGVECQAGTPSSVVARFQDVGGDQRIVFKFCHQVSSIETMLMGVQYTPISDDEDPAETPQLSVRIDAAHPVDIRQAPDSNCRDNPTSELCVCRAGANCSFYYELLDKYENIVDNISKDSVKVTLNADDATITQSFISDRRFMISINHETSGDYQLEIELPKEQGKDQLDPFAFDIQILSAYTPSELTIINNGSNINGKSIGANMQLSGERYVFTYNFKDTYGNTWLPPSVSDVSINYRITGARGSTMFSDTVPVDVNDKSLVNGVLTVTQYLTTAGSYTVTVSSMGSQLSSSINFTVTPGAPERFTITSVPYNPQVVVDNNVNLTVLATDVQGNNVNNDSTVLPKLRAFTIKAFVGSTVVCNANTFTQSAIPQDDHGLTVKNASHSGGKVNVDADEVNDNSYTISISTTIANSYSVNGLRNVYSYYILSDTTVLTCSNRYLITYLPDVPDLSKTVIGKLPTSAIEAGSPTEMEITLRDKFENVVSLGDFRGGHATTEVFKVYQCGADTEIDGVESNSTTSQLLQQISLPREAAQNVNASLSFRIQLTQTRNSDTIIQGYIPPKNVVDEDSPDCFIIPVYHSNAVDIEFDEDVHKLPRDGNSILVFSGEPLQFHLQSHDKFGNLIDYGNPAFNGKPLEFDVNQFYYRVEASYMSRIVTLPDGTQSFPASPFDGSGFKVTNTTSLILDIDKTVQEGFLVLPWVGRYELSISVFHKETNVEILKNGISDQRVHALSPFCPLDTKLNPATRECVPLTTDEPKFTCHTDPTRIGEVTPSSVTTCQCYGGMTKCPGANVCVYSTSECPKSDAVIPPRVCPEGTHLCRDLYTCVETADSCPPPPSRCSDGKVLCMDGTCASSIGECGSPLVCPPDFPFICPNNRCVNGQATDVVRTPVAKEDWKDPAIPEFTTTINNAYCDPLRPCLFPASYRCPLDGSCVAEKDQCSRTITCPAGTVLCANGQCARSADQCTLRPFCENEDARYLCPDGNCVHDLLFCSTRISCGNLAPYLCPDQTTCVADPEECTSTRTCPIERPHACPTNDCVQFPSQCPTATTCPLSLPIRCADNRCVESKDECNSATNTECPPTTPVRCSDNSCVSHINLCSTPVTCPVFKPVRCSNGECQTSIDSCPEASENSQCTRYGFVTCPLTGFCVPHEAFCPTVRKCRADEVRCPYGTCFSVFNADGTLNPNPCPSHSIPSPSEGGNVNLCTNGLIQCPVANAGIVCAPNKESCPGDIVCPPTAPVRCGDQTCRSTVEECAYVPDTSSYPSTRVPCGDGSWAASQQLCGRPTTCPPDAPVKCADTTCRVTPEDCPEVSECPSDRPFKCADGSCQVSPWSCSISVCQGDRTVRCATATSSRCVTDVNECPNILNMNTPGTFSVKSTFGTQCSDGSSVFEHRLCPPRSCPIEAPYLCDNGACARSQAQCPNTNSCPFDMPYFCAKIAKCVTSEITCTNITTGTTCGMIDDVDPETGEPIQIQMELCGDGVCRHPDECLNVTHFGCPLTAPIRCADGTCAPIPTMSGSDTVIRCKAPSDQYNACPPERPVRCRGGLCAASLSRCPSYPVTTDKAVPCRNVFDEELDSDDEPIQMMITCDDGSCAFSYAECPIVKPCQSNEFRCPDGSCKPIPCNPRNKECRERSSFTVENYLGAECSGANTCPETRPFRCQDGTCVEHVSQCIDQYPIVLGRCCGSDFYTPGSDGNSVGSCLPATNAACVETVPRDGSATGGCPASALRCPSGLCASDHNDPSFEANALCSAYNSFLGSINESKNEECKHRCASGLCVEDETQCPLTNGCPAATPVKCESSGECVVNQSDCNDECSGIVCPGSGVCVAEAGECKLPNGCPAETPILCANGECRKFATTAEGATFHPWNRSQPNGIDTTQSCPLTVTCEAYKPFVCFDGSCAISEEYCPPVFNTCPNDDVTTKCAVVCPLSLECKTVTRDADTGKCNYSEMEEVCTLSACPSSTPFICPDGSCKKTSNECREPIYDASRVLECPSDLPFRCFNGECAAKPFDCIAMTALMNHGTVLEQSDSISNVNVCKGGYVCPNGLCVDPNNPRCDVLPACPFNSQRCWDGTCARVTTTIEVDNTDPEQPKNVIIPHEPVCPEMTSSCTGGTIRCADGTCRPNGSCPLFNGCPLSKPFACTWRPGTMCTDNFLSCPGNGPVPVNPSRGESNTILSSSMHQTLATNKKYFPTHLGLSKTPSMIQRQTSAVDRHVNNVLALIKAKRLDTLKFVSLSTAVPRPVENNVLTCYENCERDVPVRQQALLVTPHQELVVDVSTNSNNLPRTQLTIKPATFLNRTEVHIYAVPQVLFDGTKSTDAVIDFPVPPTFKRPRDEDDVRDSDVVGKFGATVLSTPFSCAFKNNSTYVKPLNTVTVTSHVDLTRYDSSGDGPAVTETDFSCDLQGKWDSAFGSCTGYIDFIENEMKLRYDDCQVEGSSPETTYPIEERVHSFDATFVSSSDPDSWSKTNGVSSTQKICFRITSSARRVLATDDPDDTTTTPLSGKTICWDFVRVGSTLTIVVPTGFFSPSITLPEIEAFKDAEVINPNGNNVNGEKISNVQLSSTASCSNKDSADSRTIRKEDICLGYYTQDYEWKCILESYEARTAFPAWTTGMKPNSVRGGVGMDCSETAYAFLYVPLPPPTVIEDSFCFWCEYGWIILLCCIIFGVVLVIAILLALKFYRDRIKFKQEQARLKDLQDRAKELDEFAGGVGIADADGEIQMVANPLVLEMQELTKQLEDANNKLQTTSKQEEYEIQRLEQQRQRIYAEIARVDAELKAQNRADDKPKRVDTGVGPTAPAAPVAATGSAVPAGPVRATGPSGAPSGPVPASGPMAAPRRG